MNPRRLLILLLIAVVAGAGGFWWQGRGGEPAKGAFGQAAYERTAAILEKGPRPPGSDGLKQVRELLSRDLAAAGWVATGQPFQRNTPIGQVQFENLRARFPAGDGDPWQQPVDLILCAHVDSKYYKDIRFLGADDAASACAAVVGLAIHWARENPELAKRIELVFFDGEEAFGENITPQDGLYGSRHYANQWRARADKPKFGVLLDMVGHKDLSIKLPSDTPEVLRKAVMDAAEKEEVAGYFGMAPGPIIDDHVPLNFAGIPTVDIIGDFSRKKWWHTPMDNLDIVSAESLDISMRVTKRVVEDLLGR
jgi:hypothetical protein